MRHLLPLPLLFVASSAIAQARRPVADKIITASSLRSTVAAIAHDSMGGRATPSPGLTRTASLVAGAFGEAKLVPLGDNGTFLQTYPITHTSVIEGRAGIDFGTHTSWTFGNDYWHVGGMGSAPFGELKGPAVIVSGDLTRENVGTLGVKGKIVVYRSPLNARGTPTKFEAGFILGGAGALAVLVPGGRADTLWRRLRADPEEHKPHITPSWDSWTAQAAPLAEGVIKFMPVLEVWNGRFDQLLAHSSIDMATLGPMEGAPRVTPLPGDVRFHFDRKVDSISWAPNVVGMVVGSDPRLRHEYILITAHMDGLGRNPNGPPGPQSILNGADDNASGVAAIVHIARSLSAGPRPNRSVIIAAVSGEEMGLWGSDYLGARPPVPATQIVANINLDMVGRASGDTVYLTGGAEPRVKNQVASVMRDARRGLLVLGEKDMEARWPDDRFDERSDHVNFRRRGIPSISLFTGTHPDYHRASDDTDKLNYDALVKITRLALDLTKAIGNR